MATKYHPRKRVVHVEKHKHNHEPARQNGKSGSPDLQTRQKNYKYKKNA